MVLIVNLPQFGDAVGVFWGDTLLAFSLFESVLPISVGNQYVMTIARGALYVVDAWGNWVYCCDITVKHKAAINYGFMVTPQEYKLELIGICNQPLYSSPIIPF
jgi:hypothetical protein